MTYVFQSAIGYGRPYEYFELGLPQNSAGPHDLYAWFPGGGWSLRDHVVVVDPGWPGQIPVGRVLRDPQSPFFESMAMASVTVASRNHNAFNNIRDGNSIGDPFVQAWALGDQPELGAVRRHQGRVYRHRGTAVATALNEPGQNTNVSRIQWERIEPNDASVRRLPGIGEMNSAFRIEAGRSVWRFLQYVADNAEALNLTGRVFIDGSSAGAYAIGQAMAMRPPMLPSGMPRPGTGAAPYPVAALLDEPPFGINRFISRHEGQRSSQMLIFIASLFGDSALSQFNEWDALDAASKRAFDPLHLPYDGAGRVPVYTGSLTSFRTDRPADLVFNGDQSLALNQIGAYPNPHHAILARDFYELNGRSDSVFYERDSNGDPTVFFREENGVQTLVSSPNGLLYAGGLDRLEWMASL